MRKTAYVDFDGTIVDVMPRYHGILEHFLKEKPHCAWNMISIAFLSDKD